MEADEAPPATGAGPSSGGVPGGTDSKKPRSVKTPLQKEVLEASYQLNPTPNEEHRRALGERIGLDEKQVQAWFINRRRRDKRAEENRQIQQAVQKNMAAGAYTAQPSNSGAAAGGSVSGTAAGPAGGPTSSAAAAGGGGGTPQPAVSGSSEQPALHPHHMRVMSGPPPGAGTSPPGAAATSAAPAAPAAPTSSAAAAPPPPAATPIAAAAAPIAAAAAPMAAAAAPAAPTTPAAPPPSEAQMQEYLQLLEIAMQQLPEPRQPDGPALGGVFDDAPGDVGQKRKRVEEPEAAEYQSAGSAGVTVHPSMMKPYQRKGIVKGMDKSERDRLRAEEERMRELERAERERRKAQERMEKDRMREEQRRLRELEKQRIQQEKEARKAEAARDKERRAEEKKREKEEKKREKEMARASGVGGAAGARARVHTVVGPPDDEDVEWEQLLEAQRVAAGYPAKADTPAPEGGTTTPGGTPPPSTPALPALPPPTRPAFPPPSLQLGPAFEGDLLLPGEDAAGGGFGPDLLMISGFLHSFSDVLGLRPTPSVDQLAQAIFDGADSLVLAAVHTGMLRLLQADMEEAHASGAQASVGGPGTLIDRAMVVAAHQLEAAWAWGYDIDVWRAHLNVLTWPEVFRQIVVAMQLKPPKLATRRNNKAGGDARSRPKIGESGEDLFEDQTGALKLRLPARYTVGSVKAAAWQVLAEAGPIGLTITQIAQRIQEAGLRDLKASRTPEASVAGALSRDMLFHRIAPSTFALTSILQHAKRLGFAPPPAAQPGVKDEHGDMKPGTAPPPPLHGGQLGSPAIKQEGGDAAVSGGMVKPEWASGEGLKVEVKHEPHGSTATPMDVDAAAADPSTKPISHQQQGPSPMDVDSAAGAQKDGTSPAGGKQQGQGGEGAQQQGGEDEEYSGDEEYDEDGNVVNQEQQVVDYCREGWVNALAAQDYSALSTAERLEALLWLMHAVLDGPTLRALMDARVEEAAAIKKRQLEDAKDAKKRRQMEAQAKARAAAEEASRKLEELQAAGGTLPGPAGMPGVADGAVRGGEEGARVSDMQRAAQMAMEAAAMAAQRATAAAADDVEEEKTARQKRADAARKMDEEKAIRLEPLGLDRRHNRYWRVTAIVTPEGVTTVPDSMGENGEAPLLPVNNDPSAGRVFVESSDGSSWQLLSRPDQLNTLAHALVSKGAREGAFAANLATHGAMIKANMPSTPVTASNPAATPGSPATTPCAPTWNALLTDMQPQAHLFPCTHAPAPPATPPHLHEPPRVRKVKHDMCKVLSALPAAATLPSFDRAMWVTQVTEATHPAMLRRCLGQLETAILPAYLSAAFQTNPTIHKAAWSSPVRQQHEAEAAAAAATAHEVEGGPAPSALAEPLSWLPPTYAAVALRLQALDAALYYTTKRCGRDKMIGYRYIVRPGPLLRPSDGVPAEAAGQQPLAPFQSIEYGGIALALGSSITSTGRPRHVLLFPLMPLHLQAAPPRDFELIDIEELRAAVLEAEEQGTLLPLLPPMAAASTGGRPPRAAARWDQLTLDRQKRVHAMRVASGIVRSAFARAAQAGRGKDRDRLTKARTTKARKVRQSNLTNAAERGHGGDGEGEHDDGDGYDDGDAYDAGFGVPASTYTPNMAQGGGPASEQGDYYGEGEDGEGGEDDDE